MALTPGQDSAVRCSIGSVTADEPLAATAPLARSWLVLEQPGPWGGRRSSDSHLDPRVGEALATRSQDTGTTVLLARRVGRHADTGSATPRRFWLAHTAPGGVRMRTGTVDDPRSLLGWDLAAIAAGTLPPVGVADATPTLFVCTNARRDLCCALAGRPLASLARRAAATSTAGAPPAGGVGVLPPGRPPVRRHCAAAALGPRARPSGRPSGAPSCWPAPPGVLPLSTYRGRTALPRPLQAAEIAVRHDAGVAGLDDLDVLRRLDGRAVPAGRAEATDGPCVEAEVRHRDGRAWTVRVHRRAAPARPESCGGPPVSPDSYTATAVRAWRPWR